MKNQKLEQLFLEVKRDCVRLISQKDVNIEELSFQLGVSTKQFIENFQTRIRDFSFYLQTYHLLVEW